MRVRPGWRAATLARADRILAEREQLDRARRLRHADRFVALLREWLDVAVDPTQVRFDEGTPTVLLDDVWVSYVPASGIEREGLSLEAVPVGVFWARLAFSADDLALCFYAIERERAAATSAERPRKLAIRSLPPRADRPVRS